MSMSDPIADMLTRIRNGLKAEKQSVMCPYSGVKAAILDVLIREGFLKSYEVLEKDHKKDMRIELRYHEGAPTIKKMERVSKPGRRVYVDKGSVPKYLNGLGISVLSTSKGVICDDEARQLNIGGEVICSLY